MFVLSSSILKECSRFHAGEVLPALRSKGKNKLFDKKEVFGRVCRHDFPKSLLSIKHGERYIYSTCTVTAFLGYFLPIWRKSKMNFCVLQYLTV